MAIDDQRKSGQDVSPSPYPLPRKAGGEGSAEQVVIERARESIDRLLKKDSSVLVEDSEDDQELGELTRVLELLGALGCPAVGGKFAEEGKAVRLGRFEILEELGRGGFGIVLKAFDPLLKREVALKIPLPERLLAGQPPEDFVREAQIAACLEHPGIVRVYETQSIGMIWYIASAYCDGPTLAEWLDQQSQPLGAKQAAQFLVEVAEAVHHAHTRGVLHLDLKPENILLDLRDTGDMPRPMVTDFGLAGRYKDTSQSGPQRIAGTLAFMPPEQRAGDVTRIGTSADVYAMGAILVEMLGQHASLFNKQSDKGTTLASARIRSQAIPTDLKAICQKCLQNDPLQRYDSAKELAADLRSFIRGDCVTARSVSWPERIAREAGRRPVISALSAVLALTVISSLVAITFLWREAERSLADFRAEQSQHEETSRQMGETLLSLTRQTLESRLQPRLGMPGEDKEAILQRQVYRNIQSWSESFDDQLPHALALQASDYGLALVASPEHADTSSRNSDFRKGVEVWRKVIEQAPEELHWRRGLALHMLTYASGFERPIWLWWREPQGPHERIEESTAELAADQYAVLLVDLAGKNLQLRHYDQARFMLVSAIELLEGRKSQPDPDASRQVTTLQAYIELAEVSRVKGDQELYEQALSKGEALALTAPRLETCSPHLSSAIGEFHKARAKQFYNGGDRASAIAVYNKAKDYMKRAVDAFPDDTRNRLSFVLLLDRCATIHAEFDQRQEAIDCYREMIRLLDVGLAYIPTHRTFTIQRARAQALMAWKLLEVGDSRSAQESFEQALQSYADVKLAHHDASAEWMRAVRCWQELGRIYKEQEKYETAIKSHQQAVDLLEELRPRRGQTPQFKERLIESRDAIVSLEGIINSEQSVAEE